MSTKEAIKFLSNVCNAHNGHRKTHEVYAFFVTVNNGINSFISVC